MLNFSRNKFEKDDLTHTTFLRSAVHMCGITDSSTVNPKSKQYVLKSDKLYIAFTQLSGSKGVHLLNTYDIDRGMLTELHHKALQTICAATQANRHAISAGDIPLRSLSN